MTAALFLVPDEPEQVMLDPAAGFWVPGGELPMAAAERRKMARATRWQPKTDEDRRMLAAARWRNPLRARTVRGAGDLLEWRAPARRGPARAPAVRPKRAPSSPAEAPAPIRPAGMRVLSEEIVLPRSRRRKAAVPRRMLAGESHESLGNAPLTRAEREDLARDLQLLDGVRFGPPKDDRDCPPGVCSAIGCRHHLAIEVKGRNVTLNFPGRNVDEMPETCSLRVARKYAAERLDKVRPGEPVMTLAEVGRFLNMSEWPVQQALRSALRKIKTWLERNAARQSETR